MKTIDRQSIESRAARKINAVRNAKAPKNASIENKNYACLQSYVEELITKEK